MMTIYRGKALLRTDPIITKLITEIYLSDGRMQRQKLINKVFNGNVGLAIYWLNEMHLRKVLHSTGDVITFVGKTWQTYINLLELPKKNAKQTNKRKNKNTRVSNKI